MSTSKFEIENFDGNNDFNLWKEKMMAHFGNLGLELEKALEGKSGTGDDILKKARNTILSDTVLRKVIKEKTTSEMWNKLEELYLTKALPNRIYLKHKFYSFKMDEPKSIDEFTKLVSDSENLEIKIDEEDQAIFLLNSLPPAFDHLRDTIKYSKESLTIEEVATAAYSKELELDLKANGKRNGEVLNVQERKEKKVC